MDDAEIAVFTVELLFQILLVVAGVVITISPFFCWRYLKKIKERQWIEAQYVDSQLSAIRRSLDNIGATLLTIAKSHEELQGSIKKLTTKP